MSHEVSPCPECQGMRVPAKVLDDMRWSIDNVYASTHRFKALICTKCGHSTFYALQFQDIKRTQEQQQAKK